MNDIFISILAFCYCLVGVISLCGYFTTVRDLHVKKKMSANTVSYCIWTLTGLISFLYGIFILNDILFRIVSGMSFFSCLLVLVLTLRLKWNKSRRHHLLENKKGWQKEAPDYVI